MPFAARILSRIQDQDDGPGTLGSGDNAKYLRWNNSTARFEVGSVTVPTLLDDLSDVTIGTPTTGQLLTWNGSAWVNSAVIDGDSSRLTVRANILAQNAALYPNTYPTLTLKYQTGQYTPALEVQDINGTYNYRLAGDAFYSSLPVLGANGSVGGPSHSFITDPTTGLYRVSSGVLGVSAAGTSVVTFSSGIVDASPSEIRASQLRFGATSSTVGGDAMHAWLKPYGVTALNAVNAGTGSTTGFLTGAWTVTSDGVSAVPLTVKGVALQSANLAEWKDSSGTVLNAVNAAGEITGPINYTAANSGVTVNPILVKRGGSSSYPRAIEYRNYDGTPWMWVDWAGGVGVRQFLFGADPGGLWMKLSNGGPFIINDGSSQTLFRCDHGRGTHQFFQFAAAEVAVTIKGAVSQTANLTEWKDSAGTVLSFVTSAGAAKFSHPLVTQTANYTLTATDHICLLDATSASVTITLPTAVGCAGREYVVKRTDASGNSATVATTSSQTIDGGATVALAQRYQSITAVSDGANWVII